ncbi:tellurite resistance TerB family protein [Bosea sp. R86505]|uniref:tellurite resistance TerB family protein n=1 Tax=Bosea sp. R86505 TaxID=3101710 RepID=UPI0036713301
MFNAKSLLDALVSAGTQAGQPGGQGRTGSLGQILGGLATKVQQGGGLGGLAGMAGQILTQASQGVGDAARQTGVQQKAGDVMGQVTGGRSAQDVLAQAKAMFDKNPAMATAVLGGLGALVFGSSTGRAVVGSAARLGGMALIGGLAYKAYQNHQAGKPLLDVSTPELLPPPRGTGFEAEAATEATALLFIRAMIAAAAADGAIDAEERTAILGGLREAGFDQEANEWLEQEMASPASIETLVAGAESPELAAQIYTAARIAINPDTPGEKDFLAGLSASLGLDAELVANIDAAASAAKV